MRTYITHTFVTNVPRIQYANPHVVGDATGQIHTLQATYVPDHIAHQQAGCRIHNTTSYMVRNEHDQHTKMGGARIISVSRQRGIQTSGDRSLENKSITSTQSLQFRESRVWPTRVGSTRLTCWFIIAGEEMDGCESTDGWATPSIGVRVRNRT